MALLQRHILLTVLAVLTIGITQLRFSHVFFGFVSYSPMFALVTSLRGDSEFALSALKRRIWIVLTCVAGWNLAVLKICTPPLLPMMAPAFGFPIGLMHAGGFVLFDLLWRSEGPALNQAQDANHLRAKQVVPRTFHVFRKFLLFAGCMALTELVQIELTPYGAWGMAANFAAGPDGLLFFQLVSLVGSYGLSRSLYLAQATIGEWLLSRWIAKAEVAYERSRASATRMVALVLLAGMLFGWGRLIAYDLLPATGDSVTVGLIGTDSTFGGLPLPSRQSIALVETNLFDRASRAAAGGAKLVAWPEAGHFVFSESEEQGLIERVSMVAKRLNVSIIGGFVIPLVAENSTSFGYLNRFLFVSSDGHFHTYNKHYPVPGEPCTPGNEPLVAGNVFSNRGDVVQVSGAICYDYDFLGTGRGHAQIPGVGIAVVPSSDWRGIDPIHTHMAAMRASEFGLSMVRPTRLGLSAAIDPFGRVLAQSSHFVNGPEVIWATVSTAPVLTAARLHPLLNSSWVFLVVGFAMVGELRQKGVAGVT